MYDEVKYEGQNVIGTRFVLTEKDDKSIKARFVIKGFQEDINESDSPTESRETLKVFLTISANKNGFWKDPSSGQHLYNLILLTEMFC